MKYKDVQTKIQAEVDDLLMERSEKSVTIADRSKLIYTEATIMEALRIISSPLVPHVASQNSSIDGKSMITHFDPLKFDGNFFLSQVIQLKLEHYCFSIITI